MRFEIFFAVGCVAIGATACRSSKLTQRALSDASAASPTSSAPATASIARAVPIPPSASSTAAGSAWQPWPSTAAAELRSGQREMAFAMALSRHLADAQTVHGAGGSFVFAPVSLAAILALSYEGARGATRSEIGTVLGLSEASSAEEALSLAQLASFTTNESLRAAHATAVWTAAGVTVEPAFQVRATSQYQAAFLPGTRAQSPTDAVNAWLKDSVAAPVQLLLAADAVRADARLAIIDFLSVEGTWRTPFAPERTRPLPFTSADGKKINLPTMTSVGTLLAASEPDFDAVELSLTSLEHHLLIVAPKPGKMRALQEGMAARLPAIRAGLRPTYAELRLPRYSLNNSLRLREALNKAGIVTAFSESADFGAMVEGRVFLDQVLQNVAFEVNERGLRAASATVASYPPPSAPRHPVLIQINRPFLFGLMNLRTGAMLFWGTYAGPAH